MKELEAIGVPLESAPYKQISLTDPDARSMGHGHRGPNVQTAVATKNRLIDAHDVTNDGLVRDQLSKTSKQARKAMRAEYLTIIADRGYFKSDEILACHKAGIVPLVPKSTTFNAKAEGRLDTPRLHANPSGHDTRCRPSFSSECASDDHGGLKKAISEVLTEVVWQRCQVHFLRNAFEYLPRKADDDCLQELRWIYDWRDIQEANRDLSV